MIIKQKETGLVKRGNRGFVSKACAFICKGNSGKIFIKSICLSLLFLACDSPKGITDLSKPCPELKMKYQNRKVDVQRPFVEKESFSDLEKLDEPIGLGTKFTIHFSEEMHEKDLSEAVEKNYVFLVEKAVLESDRFKEDLQTISINEEFKSKFPKIKTTASLKDGKSILSGEILQELDD